jgi:hypothetical protein
VDYQVELKKSLEVQQKLLFILPLRSIFEKSFNKFEISSTCCLFYTHWYSIFKRIFRHIGTFCKLYMHLQHFANLINLFVSKEAYICSPSPFDAFEGINSEAP